MYPYFTVNSLPSFTDFSNPHLWMLIVAEFVCFSDMIVHFFLQDADEEGGSKQETLSVVANKYFKGNFKQDLFIFLPWGLFFSQYDKRLKFFWVTKGLRIFSLNYYLSDQTIIPLIDQIFDSVRDRAIQDQYLREDINSDHIYNFEQILFINGMKIFRQFLRILAIAYYIGQYWFVFAASYYEFVYDKIITGHHEDDHEIEEHYHSYIHYESNWNILGAAPGKRVLINTYFSMTSLSTVGFGDYYPVSDMERLLGAFVLLFGVALFSLFMGQLLEMIDKIKSLDNDISEEDKLEQFFMLLRDQFNRGQPLNPELTQSIINFMNFQWQNNRNNFLMDHMDQVLFDQLHTNTKLAIYKDFVFKEFLYLFRRFFSFRFALVQKQEDIKMMSSAINSEYMIINPNLRKLQKKVKQMMLIRRQMQVTQDSDNTKWTKEQIIDDIERIKERLSNIENKQNQQEIKRKKKLNTKQEYGRRCGPIHFPFMTFENDDRYAAFMTQIMRNLEARFFMPQEIIYKELDECLQVLFVLEGKYSVGYEINNFKRFRKQFGPSTIIGGFNVCFQKRMFFYFKAHTQMMCYSIRKQQWKEIMDEFPELYRNVKEKIFNFYFNQIYRPMLRLKLIDIQNTNMRNDYNQVLAVTSDGFDELKSCMHSIYSEQEKNMIEISNKLIEERKIIWLLKKIESKLEDVIDMFIDITHKLEFLQIQLWKKVTTKLEAGNVWDTYEYVKRINKIAFPPRVDYDDIMHVTKLFNFDLVINQLKRNVYGASKFWEIKDNQKRKELESMFKEFTQTQIKNRLTAMYQKSMLDQMKNEYNKSKAHNKMKGIYDDFLKEAHVDDSNCHDNHYIIDKVDYQNYKSMINEQESQNESQHSFEFNHTVESQHNLLPKGKPRRSHYLMDVQTNKSLKSRNQNQNIIIMDQSMISANNLQPNQQFSFIETQDDKFKPIHINQMQIQQENTFNKITNKRMGEQKENNQDKNSESIPVIQMNDLGNIERPDQNIIINQNILGQINNEYQNHNNQMERAQQNMQKHKTLPVDQKESTNQANQAIDSMEDVSIQFQTQSNEDNQDNQKIKLDEFLDGQVNLNGLEFTKLKQEAVILTPKNNFVNSQTNEIIKINPTSQNFIISQRQKEVSRIEPNVYTDVNNLEDQKQNESSLNQDVVRSPQKQMSKEPIIILDEKSQHSDTQKTDDKIEDQSEIPRDSNKDEN